MHFFACDVSRDSIDAVLVDRALTIKNRFMIANTAPAVTAILRTLQSDGLHVTAGIESTALFHRAVVEACTEVGITCKLINPILTKQITRHSIRNRKTDRDDALVIAKLLIQGEGNAVTTGDVVDELKTLVRSARKLAALLQSLQLHVRFVGRTLGYVPPVLEQEYVQLKLAKTQMQLLAQGKTDGGKRALLESIPGIGPWIASVLLAETQNFSRCDSGKALVAAAGLDPRVKQSGISLKCNGRLTKRGSPHLRWALCCAASSAARYDAEIKAYFEKKRSEGKSYRAALCATARKMAYRAYAVVKRGRPYLERSAGQETAVMTPSS